MNYYIFGGAFVVACVVMFITNAICPNQPEVTYSYGPGGPRGDID